VLLQLPLLQQRTTVLYRWAAQWVSLQPLCFKLIATALFWQRQVHNAACIMQLSKGR
jgi:hypothetical protein